MTTAPCWTESSGPLRALTIASPFGDLALAASDTALVSLHFPGHRYRSGERHQAASDEPPVLADDQPGAAQAVGNANGRNPISIIVPCHRVIGSDATLHGYAGGLHVKRGLLELEGSLTAPLF